MAMPSFMSVFVAAKAPSFADPAEFLTIIEGSGFVLRLDGQELLITNRHVVTGRGRVDDKPLGTAMLPTHIDVRFPMASSPIGAAGLELIGTRKQRLALYDAEGAALWLVHPHFGRYVDVIALPLDLPSDEQSDVATHLIPYELGTDNPVARLEPTDALNVVGFPYGLVAGAFSAIWVRGSVASQPDLQFDGEPCFLIDARTREAQSGSPVIRYVREEPPQTPSESWDLIGVYSSRIGVDAVVDPRGSDLGRVWAWSALKSVAESGVRDDLRLDRLMA